MELLQAHGQAFVVAGQEHKAALGMTEFDDLQVDALDLGRLGGRFTSGEHQKVWGSRSQQLLRLTWESVLVGEGHAQIIPCFNS